MIKKPQKASLADKIAGVLNAAPAEFDPEDENIDDTTAKLTSFEDVNEENDVDEVLPVLLSKFRKGNDLLADVDAKYVGKKGSRKNLKDESSDEYTEEEDEAATSDDLNDSDERDEHSDNIEKDISEAEESGSDNEDASEDSDNGSIALSEENDSNFKHMTETNVSEQVKKGLCVRNQLNIWENLLEMRIQMQKCLVAANKMPQKSYYKEIEKDSECMDFRKKIKETKDSLGNVLEKFLSLQNLVIKKYPETKNLTKTDKAQPENDSDDEEIPSDTDEDIEVSY